MREDLQNKMEQTREAIRNAIMKGDSTVKLRQFLAEQEQALAKLSAQEQAQAQAQRVAEAVAQRAEVERLASDAAQLAAARHARLSCLSERFRIPARA